MKEIIVPTLTCALIIAAIAFAIYMTYLQIAALYRTRRLNHIHEQLETVIARLDTIVTQNEKLMQMQKKKEAAEAAALATPTAEAADPVEAKAPEPDLTGWTGFPTRAEYEERYGK